MDRNLHKTLTALKEIVPKGAPGRAASRLARLCDECEHAAPEEPQSERWKSAGEIVADILRIDRGGKLSAAQEKIRALWTDASQ